MKPGSRSFKKAELGNLRTTPPKKRFVPGKCPKRQFCSYPQFGFSFKKSEPSLPDLRPICGTCNPSIAGRLMVVLGIFQKNDQPDETAENQRNQHDNDGHFNSAPALPRGQARE
jgi:hypothetical protein